MMRHQGGRTFAYKTVVAGGTERRKKNGTVFADSLFYIRHQLH
jgi:hypothetical protein